MFRTRKSRKNIIGLIDTLRPHQKNRENTQDNRQEKKGEGKKKTNKRTASVSPRGDSDWLFIFSTIIVSDEGYITGNEKNYEILKIIEDESDNWEVDTEDDSDQDERKKDDMVRGNEKYNDPPPPVRNQVAYQANIMGQHLVRYMGFVFHSCPALFFFYFEPVQLLFSYAPTCQPAKSNSGSAAMSTTAFAFVKCTLWGRGAKCLVILPGQQGGFPFLLQMS